MGNTSSHGDADENEPSPPEKEEPVPTNERSDIKPKHAPSSEYRSKRRRKCGKRFVQMGGISISVIKGNITEQTYNTDVIVNSAVPELILKNGTASGALLKAAGHTIQAECREKYPSGITTRDIAVTGPGKLKCRAIYHVTLPKWQNAGDEENVEKLVQKCLSKAHEEKFKSVSFPAFGTGFLKYPTKRVVDAMFKAVDGYTKSKPDSAIKIVNCVVYTHDTFKEFLEEAKKRALSKGLQEMDLKIKTSLQDNVGNIGLTIAVGSIVSEEADVIVNSCATNMKLDSRPGLAKSIVEAAGKELQNDIDRRYPNGIKIGELAVTNGFSLKCRKIYHGHLIPFVAKKEDGLLPEQILYNFVHKCLEDADGLSVKSIVFPALGTGFLKFPAKTAALHVLKAIRHFQTENQQSSLKSIKIVIFGGTNEWLSIEQAYIAQFTATKQKDTAIAQALPVIPKRDTFDFLAYKYKEEARTPSNWTHFTNKRTLKEWNINNKESPYKIKSVDKKTFESISNAFTKTLVGARIVSIERIENIQLYEKYSQECQRLFRKAYVTEVFTPLKNVAQSTGTVCIMQYLDSDITKHVYEEINEFYLFHGTKQGYVQAIIQQGLDDRLASSGLLGTGVYSAERASKSAGYTDKNAKGESKMFLMRVCLGDIFITRHSNPYKRPPCKECYSDTCTDHSESDLFDSIAAEFKTREFVVYDRAKCYPEYLITYK